MDYTNNNESSNANNNTIRNNPTNMESGFDCASPVDDPELMVDDDHYVKILNFKKTVFKRDNRTVFKIQHPNFPTRPIYIHPQYCITEPNPSNPNTDVLYINKLFCSKTSEFQWCTFYGEWYAAPNSNRVRSIGYKNTCERHDICNQIRNIIFANDITSKAGELVKSGNGIKKFLEECNSLYTKSSTITVDSPDIQIYEGLSKKLHNTFWLQQTNETCWLYGNAVIPVGISEWPLLASIPGAHTFEGQLHTSANEYGGLISVRISCNKVYIQSYCITEVSAAKSAVARFKNMDLNFSTYLLNPEAKMFSVRIKNFRNSIYPHRRLTDSLIEFFATMYQSVGVEVDPVFTIDAVYEAAVKFGWSLKLSRSSYVQLAKAKKEELEKKQAELNDSNNKKQSVMVDVTFLPEQPPTQQGDNLSISIQESYGKDITLIEEVLIALDEDRVFHFISTSDLLQVANTMNMFQTALTNAQLSTIQIYKRDLGSLPWYNSTLITSIFNCPLIETPQIVTDGDRRLVVILFKPNFWNLDTLVRWNKDYAKNFKCVWFNVEEKLDRKMFERFYDNCLNRPYGKTWEAYLQSTPVVYASFLCQSVAAARQICVEFREKNGFPWNKNEIHCSANIVEANSNTFSILSNTVGQFASNKEVCNVDEAFSILCERFKATHPFYTAKADEDEVGSIASNELQNAIDLTNEIGMGPVVNAIELFQNVTNDKKYDMKTMHNMFTIMANQCKRKLESPGSSLTTILKRPKKQ